MLIVKLSSLGDVVHALPVATVLRRGLPGTRITWAVEEAAAPLLAGHPAIDRVVVFPPGRWRSFGGEWCRRYRAARRLLCAEGYDVAIDLQGLARSAAIVLQSGTPRRLGAPRPREGAWLVSPPVAAPAGAHAVDEYLACAGALGVAPQPVAFDLAPEASARRRVAERLARLGVGADRPLIAINPSSSKTRKSWPDGRWSAVIEALAAAATVVVIGGLEQRRRHAALVARAASGVLDLTGDTSIAEVIALLARADLHLAPDTGTLHIAAALGRPVVGLYGPTSPARLAPYGQPEGVIYRGGCAATCPGLCPRQRRCLTAVTADEVVAAVRRRLVASRAESSACDSGTGTGTQTGTGGGLTCSDTHWTRID